MKILLLIISISCVYNYYLKTSKKLKKKIVKGNFKMVFDNLIISEK